jgi:hypothetical protein
VCMLSKFAFLFIKVKNGLDLSGVGIRGLKCIAFPARSHFTKENKQEESELTVCCTHLVISEGRMNGCVAKYKLRFIGGEESLTSHILFSLVTYISIWSDGY